ncbi:MAG: putative bifunctional diguanylate cyclase/phosphodiesterase, partial [Octadecabacter sp.]
PLENLIGRSPLEHALPDEKRPSPEEIANFRFDPTDPKWDDFELVENQRPDGTMFWNQINVSFVKTADGRENAILMCRDVTEQIKQQADFQQIAKQLEYEATHDAMTDVPNRAAFLTFIEDALSTAGRKTVGLLHIDLDNFKDTNDTHGHSAGDAVLIHTANVIRDNIRSCDLVARVGGDEFVVVCPQTNDLDYLNRFSNVLIDAISEPFEWNGRIFQIEASIGAALSQSTSSTAEDLLVQSDFALYEAKRAGRNQVALYNEDLHERHTQQTRRACELSRAVNKGDLAYCFQPTLSLTTGQITGFETLVRWNHSTDGLIQPDDFLPTVKDLGLLGVMDLWSMNAALSQKRKLNMSGFEHLGIAFNASPELLRHPDFINRLVWGVEASGIRREQITIEVLETTNFGNVAEMSSHAATIRDLRIAGFQVHLDDFGVGFAGLSHLASLDVSGVKIDRGLVTDLLTDDVSRKIVRKIVELSNDLGLTVIAEGVEDSETADALRLMGCGVIQGYWLSKPIPRDDLITWLGNRQEIITPLRA